MLLVVASSSVDSLLLVKASSSAESSSSEDSSEEESSLLWMQKSQERQERMSTFTKECNQILHLILGFAWNDVVSNDREDDPAETGAERKKKHNKLTSDQQENMLVLKVEEWTTIFFNPAEKYYHIPRHQILTESRMMSEETKK